MGRLENFLFFSLLLFLPTQLGQHFWPEWTQILGLRIDYLSPTLYLTDILLFLLFIIIVLPQSLFKLKVKIKTIHLWLLLVLIASLLIGIYESKNPIAGFYQLAKWIEMVFFALYLSQKIKSYAQFGNSLLILATGLFFESLLAIGQFLNQKSLGGIFWWFGERNFSGQTPGIAQAAINGELLLRSYGTFSHPNVLAGYLVVILSLLLAFNWKRWWQKGIQWLAITSGTLALFFTFSRVAWLLGFVVILYWLIYQRKWLAVILLLFLCTIGFSFIQGRFQTLMASDRESLDRRQELNLAAWGMIKADPLFGVGMGNFLVNLPDYQQDVHIVRFLQPAHNVYLMVGAETGFVGLTALLAFLLLTYQKLFSRSLNRSLIRAQNKKIPTENISTSLIIALSVILSLSFFDHYFYTLQQGQLLLALIIGFSWIKIKVA